MNTYLIYRILLAALVALELVYFRLADHFNIIDKPNERSSHSKVVLRGGGVIFTLGLWLWSAFFGFLYPWALAVLVPLLLKNRADLFVEESFLVVIVLAVLVFCIFNFRPKNKAKCFAGDVGSVGIAFILLFAIGKLIMQTGDVTWLVLLLVYGVDGCLTICHRIMLHEPLGVAHRTHCYQLMANELGLSHVTVSLLYMALQLAVSLGFIYLCPDSVLAHWIYLLGAAAVLCAAYVLFMKKYYHLHEEYLKGLKGE